MSGKKEKSPLVTGKTSCYNDGEVIEVRKILVLHGWYHSKRRYEKLAQDLWVFGEMCCTAVDLPGFGGEPYEKSLEHIEEEQVAFVRNLLHQTPYDVVIAHSWGGRILLQALEREDTLCILLNPAYGDNKTLRVLQNKEKMLETMLDFAHTTPAFLSTAPIKVASLPSVNRLHHMDDILLEDVRESNPKVACKILEIMVHTPYFRKEKPLKNPLHLLYSDQDRVIHPSCFQALRRDLQPKSWLFSGVGHTLVLECYPQLLDKIKTILEHHFHQEFW